MNHYDSNDDLDRALFALDLEEPPAGMREAILAGTVYRAPLPVSPWEIWAIGIAAAVAVWLMFTPALALDAVSAGASVLGRPDVLFWLAVGGGAAAWISHLNLTLLPGVARTPRR